MDHNNHRIKKIKLLLLTATYLAVRNRSRRKRCLLKRTPKQTSHQQLPSQLGEYRTICRQLEQNPACNYLLYLRMTETHFRKLLKLIEPHLIGGRRSSSLVDTAKVKLVVTLRFLTTGQSLKELAQRFHLQTSTARSIVQQTLKAIIAVVLPIAIPKQTQSSWTKISRHFLDRWNLPNCLGAISGTLFASDSSSMSTVLMAAVDAKYKFVMVDVGAHNEQQNVTVFGDCNFGRCWINKKLKLQVPPNTPLPDQNRPIPYFMVADEAFDLSTNVMTPFAGADLSMTEVVYNFRHKRAQRVVSTAIGMLTSTWNVLQDEIYRMPTTANDIIFACCVLHNFVRLNANTIRDTPIEDISSESEEDGDVDDGRDERVQPAGEIRQRLADWCVSEGDVDFQYN